MNGSRVRISARSLPVSATKIPAFDTAGIFILTERGKFSAQRLLSYAEIISQTPKYTNMKTNQEDSRKKKTLVAVIIALLLIAFIIFYFISSEKKEQLATAAEKSALDSTFRSLTDTLNARNADIDKYKSLGAHLDSAISANQKIIDGEKKQISDLLHNEKMTVEQLAQVDTIMASYQASITDLQKQISGLAAENQQLTSDNDVLICDIDSVKKAAAQLAEQNRKLAGKVVLGSLLQLNDLKIEGVKKRNNGKEAVVKNFKATESLRVSFETGNNKSLSPGALALYIKITNPKGETIYLPNYGSGSIELAKDGSSMQYTREADIDWNQTNKKVIVYWTQNINSPGVYSAEVYQSGYPIGSAEVKLNWEIK